MVSSNEDTNRDRSGRDSNASMLDASDYAARLAAIVECSDDAIISKDIDGVITSWNAGAEQLFGYSAEEAIGQPVTIIVPPDRRDEEVSILERIRRGERVRHYETVRLRKDGATLDVWLAVSPIRNAKGEVVGASKIARDITDRRRAQERQVLLLREMNHRIKNLFALAGSVVTMSARFSKSVEELVETVRERLGALARAHDLTMPDVAPGAGGAEKHATLGELADAILSPYGRNDGGRKRFSLEGPELPIAGGSLTCFALLLHEFATNAVKHGALSRPEGQIDIEWRVSGEELHLAWRESGGPAVTTHGEAEGFGSSLAQAATSQLGGRISRDWNPGGLAISLVIPLKGFLTVYRIANSE
jgi:PAS domain S-box-containing protein